MGAGRGAYLEIRGDAEARQIAGGSPGDGGGRPRLVPLRWRGTTVHARGGIQMLGPWWEEGGRNKFLEKLLFNPRPVWARSTDEGEETNGAGHFGVRN